MPFPYTELRQKLVHHLIALEALDPAYAVWALDQYRKEPSGLYREILADVRAEKSKRATCPTPESAQ
jgi:hypothetical protein